MIVISSFAFGVLPTRDTFTAMKNAGVMSRSVMAYTRGSDYANDAGGFLAVVNGDPKYFADPNLYTPSSCFQLDGTQHKASQMSPDENQVYSTAARQWYGERPNLDVPTLQNKIMSTSEWVRVSFPTDSVLDPEEYPISPASGVFFMHDGKACWAGIGEASSLFPVTPQMPTGPGALSVSMSGAEVIALVLKMANDVTKRISGRAIAESNNQIEQKLANLKAL